MTETHAPPNHHAAHPAFAGVPGLVAALSMAFGRKGDARLAERLSGMQVGDTVVDVGCGPGVAVRHAARYGAVAIGVDPAPVMLRVAKLRGPRRTGERYLEGTAEALPLPDRSARILWSIATVHHWADIDAGLEEARRVLLPGGRLVAIERETGAGARGLASHGWTNRQAAEFSDLCRDHGFTDVRVERTTTGRRSTVSVVASSP